eukprot:scaffold669991_cov84-Prasinocladus_malaysianus.AAC.1
MVNHAMGAMLGTLRNETKQLRLRLERRSLSTCVNPIPYIDKPSKNAPIDSSDVFGISIAARCEAYPLLVRPIAHSTRCMRMIDRRD